MINLLLKMYRKTNFPIIQILRGQFQSLELILGRTLDCLAEVDNSFSQYEKEYRKSYFHSGSTSHTGSSLNTSTTGDSLQPHSDEIPQPIQRRIIHLEEEIQFYQKLIGRTTFDIDQFLNLNFSVNPHDFKAKIDRLDEDYNHGRQLSLDLQEHY